MNFKGDVVIIFDAKMETISNRSSTTKTESRAERAGATARSIPSPMGHGKSLEGWTWLVNGIEMNGTNHRSGDDRGGDEHVKDLLEKTKEHHSQALAIAP